MPMPTQASAAPALALENAAIEAEIERLSQQRQYIAASSDMVTPVSERYRNAVYAAKLRVQAAERAMAIADTQARLRIRQQQPSEQLARVWFEEAMLSPGRELEQARTQLAAAELALGQAVQARRALEAFTATEQQAHADIDAECQARHAALDATRRRLRAAVID